MIPHFKINCAGLLLLLSGALHAQDYIAPGRQALAPLPASTSGVKGAVTSLAGTWQINLTKEPSGWQKIQVPGEPAMQGITIQHDQPFQYRRDVTIPADAAGKTLAIRFNGVYNHAKVWVDGHLLREHFGGFTAWECDITPYASAGKTVQLVVEVTDRTDDISFASGYAHHPIGGILRDVQLVIRPTQHLSKLYTRTKLSPDFGAAELSLEMGVNKSTALTSVSWTLTAPDGSKVVTQRVTVKDAANITDKIALPQVKTWTAETPSLYQLSVTLYEKGIATETIRQQIGFREVMIRDKNQLLVNGKPVKLRGACHHDMDPLMGRSTHRAQDSLDVILAKEANLNFIRTSHYPPTQDLLEFCDRYGIYVQEETAICFVGQDRGGDYNKYSSTQNDTAFTARYLGQLSEMIDRDRNHAAIIMWSVGNESSYGSNFQQEYDFVKRIDPSRPVSWSWPTSALKEGKRCFDIAVGHYPIYSGNGGDMGGIDQHMMHPDFPLLSDEWAHVACYNTGLLKYDPNTKDFWGRSIDTTWLNRFDVPGNAGGAIWGMIDETFHLPGKVTGYGPWGIVDVWRRKKAEFWNTKKAYSPIRIGTTVFTNARTGDVLQLPVKNRFDHLSLSEVICKVTSSGKKFSLKMPAIAPHETGVIAFDTKNLSGSAALLQFFSSNGQLIDEEKISWGPRPAMTLPAKSGTWTTGDKLFSHGRLSLYADKTPDSASISNVAVMTGMPDIVINSPVHWDAFKNTEGKFSGATHISETSVSNTNSGRTWHLQGMNGNYPVKMDITMYASGLVEVAYEADSIPLHTWEIGVKVPLSGAMDKITWQRNGYWSTYPEGHLSANTGSADKNSGAVYHYRQRPAANVAEDMTDYYLAGSIEEAKATTAASESYRAKKENILEYIVSGKKLPGSVKVVSDGSQAAKMQIDADGRQWLIITDKWDYWSLAWGNYQGTANPSRKVKGVARFIIE
ncbi:glycoside hydrolase family 2 protein [Chitinophaga arvensicola]|uniref:beta-galactosidase n=1 Tax=Chitinophaga arvensicola TaxID=29529 RepID=A0A1I0RT53_9BACT|nr:glycoside hydrolase family 2 TIM barrel-domain containing protein [Chitinophaga arvensicola]SEW44462.1 Beta-galactosidase/beta-glucuronidase [Chitinophaga arvensicola]